MASTFVKSNTNMLLELHCERNSLYRRPLSHLSRYDFLGVLCDLDKNEHAELVHDFDEGWQPPQPQPHDVVVQHHEIRLDSRTLCVLRLLTAAEAPHPDPAKTKTFRTVRTYKITFGEVYVFLDMAVGVGVGGTDQVYTMTFRFNPPSWVDYDVKHAIRKAVEKARVLLLRRTESDVMGDAMSLVRNGVHKPYVSWPFNKPVNFKTHHTNFVKTQCLCFRKMDGVRSLLLVKNMRVYGLNEKDGVVCMGPAVLKGKYDLSTMNDSVLDVEVMSNGVVHVFDTLVFNKHVVTELPYMARNQFTDLVFADHVDCWWLIREHGTQNPVQIRRILHEWVSDKTDGVVFTPIDAPYKNTCTFKYKPCNRLTIDFARIPDSDVLYVQGPSGLVEFKGTPLFPCRGRCPGRITGIHEYIYDKTTHEFMRVRARSDKTKPNYVDVAIDVWNDIMCGPELEF